MRRRVVALVVAGGLAVNGVACQEALSYESGEREALIVEGGVFVRGEPPEGEDGPYVRATYLSTRTFHAGKQGKTLSGVLDPDASAVVLRLAQEAAGYWLVPAGPPLPDTPDFPSFEGRLSFGPELLPGPYALSIVAMDGQGRGGPPALVQFALRERPLPQGELVFSLDWDHDADLDLRVVTPGGVEIHAGNVREHGALAPGADPELLGGRLDFDSNKDCRIDGRRNENVIFTDAPSPGRYVVRVETFSLCEQSHARWRVAAVRAGVVVAATSGLSGPTDTRFSAGQGAGIIALELWVE